MQVGDSQRFARLNIVLIVKPLINHAVVRRALENSVNFSESNAVDTDFVVELIKYLSETKTREITNCKLATIR